MMIFGKQIKGNYHKIDLEFMVDGNVREFCKSFMYIFPDHTKGNTEFYIDEDGYILACSHFEHCFGYDIMSLANLIKDIGVQAEIILWDGYWEKILLTLR